MATVTRTSDRRAIIRRSIVELAWNLQLALVQTLVVSWQLHETTLALGHRSSRGRQYSTSRHHRHEVPMRTALSGVSLA
jgi:hypothetical protein